MASTFYSQSDRCRFAKRSCASAAHTNYLKTTHTHTHPTAQSRQTGFRLARTGKKAKKKSNQDVLMCGLWILPAACISKVSVGNLSANIFEGEIIVQQKTVSIPGRLAVSVSFHDAISLSARRGNPAPADRAHAHGIDSGSSASERPVGLCPSPFDYIISPIIS